MKKSVDAAGFYFCKISKKCKLVYNKKQISDYFGMGEKNDKGVGGKFGGWWLMYYLDCEDDFIL